MEELEQLVDAVDQILAVAADEKSAQDVACGLREITRQVNRLQAAICEHVAAMKAIRAHEVAACANSVEFLKKECHYSGAQARAIERCTAFLSGTLPNTASALRCGKVTWPHVLTIARAVDVLGVKEVGEREAIWIDKIATKWGPERLQRVVRARVHETSAKPTVQRPRSSARSRNITLRPVGGAGFAVGGRVTLDDGAMINSAVSALADEATVRTADPIVTIIREWLHSRKDRSRDQSQSRLMVTADLDTPDEFAHVRRIEFQLVQPAASRSEPPSQFRRTHGATSHHGVNQTPADDSRDERCIRPGCRCQPKWCDLHSILEWIDTGRGRAA